MPCKVHEVFTKLMVELLLVGNSAPACLLDISQQHVPPVIVCGELERISEVNLNTDSADLNDIFRRICYLVLLVKAAKQGRLDILHVTYCRVHLPPSLDFLSRHLVYIHLINSCPACRESLVSWWGPCQPPRECQCQRSPGPPQRHS